MGPEANLLDPTASSCRQISVARPILNNDELDKLVHIDSYDDVADFRSATILILSDRHSTEELAPIPSLLFTSAVHHHLIREKTRTKVGLIVECGDAREVHHMTLLLGYGAAAINPYLAFETIDVMIDQGHLTGVSKGQAIRNYIKACGKGILKIMSKMGISTVASYTGAQVFEAIGLEQATVDEYFTGTTS